MEYPQQPEEDRSTSEMVKRFHFLFTGIFISTLEIILGKDKNIAKGTTDPRVEFILQALDQFQFQNLD